MTYDEALRTSKLAPPPLCPKEGLSALHLFFKIDLAAWRDKQTAERSEALGLLEELVSIAKRQPQTQVVTLSMLARADLGFFVVTPDLQYLNQLEKKLRAALGGNVLIPVFSYLSLTERSEYQMPEEEYAADLEKNEGVKRDSVEFEEKLAAFRERLQHYRHDRLYPVLPDWEYFCFYPMSKRRQPGQNWYALEYEQRRKLMGGHMRVGRTYAGRVRQLVTGSTGLDDWEWGVTLFAHDPLEIKSIVYEMRFDEVTHTYGEFGPFFNGLPMSLRNIYSRLLLA